MASNIYTQTYADGTQKRLMRGCKQGRKPSGLGKPVLVRLNEADEETIAVLKEKYGEYWNLNEFIREAVSDKLRNSVYTELLKT